MRAVMVENGQLSVRDDLPQPAPLDGEALIRVTVAGICATDLEIVKGYGAYEGILGHEFAGIVEQASDEVWVGRRVVGSINLGCGTCAVCLSDGPEHCAQRTVLGIHDRPGVFADYVTLPIANLHAVPRCVPDERAVFTEPLAAAVRILQQVAISSDVKIGVIGPGRMGMLIGQVLGKRGATVTMLGRSDSSLQLARQIGMPVMLVETCEDDHFAIVVEATGNEAGLAHALRIVRPLGTLVMKSTFAGKARVDLTKLVVGEITVIGSRCGPFDDALSLLAEDAVQVLPLVDGDYPLSQALSAFAHAAQPGVRKVLLRP